MDRKTLEYMEEKARKARSIVLKIEDLLKKIERIDQIAQIHCGGDQGNNNLFILSSRYSDQSQNNARLISTLKPVLTRLITDEIALLETELAEL